MDGGLHHLATAPWSTSIALTFAVAGTALFYLRGLRRFRRCYPERAAGCKLLLSSADCSSSGS